MNESGEEVCLYFWGRMEGVLPKRPKRSSANSVLMRFSILIFPWSVFRLKGGDFSRLKALRGSYTPPMPSKQVICFSGLLIRLIDTGEELVDGMTLWSVRNSDSQLGQSELGMSKQRDHTFQGAFEKISIFVYTTPCDVNPQGVKNHL